MVVSCQWRMEVTEHKVAKRRVRALDARSAPFRSLRPRMPACARSWPALGWMQRSSEKPRRILPRGYGEVRLDRDVTCVLQQCFSTVRGIVRVTFGLLPVAEIGRASCRERVCPDV